MDGTDIMISDNFIKINLTENIGDKTDKLRSIFGDF